MRVLTSARRQCLLVALVGAILAAMVGPATADPPNDPDHGVNETTFYTLWAGDDEAPNRSELDDRVEESSIAVEELAAGSDIPYEEPPAAVAQWNRGDHGEFPSTGTSRSVHPPHVSVTSGQYIKDAAAAVFAVQPSTRARLTKTESSDDSHPLYVAPNGTLLGTVDYRVRVPPDETRGDREIEWELTGHGISDTRLLVDGTVETRTDGSKTPRLSYRDLDAYVGAEHTLTLEATISVTLERTVRRCVSRNPRDGSCLRWVTRTTEFSESVDVRDSRTVEPYTLTVSGFRTVYPDGTFGLVVYKNQPWLGYSAPNSGVRGVWRFYSARDKRWDTLVTQTASGSSESHSPLHPLQVHAYPSEPGPMADPRRTITLQAAYGSERDPPSLPAAVNLDTLTEPYTASYGIAARLDTDDHDVESITAHGLVRGSDVALDPEAFSSVPYRESNLTLTVERTAPETTTVRVTLRERGTGAPIATTDREGYVLVDGTRTNTSGNGAVTLTIETDGGGISAQYLPGRWWRTSPAYTADSDSIYVGGTVPDVVATLYRAGIPVALLLFCVFIIDRMTGWDIWPPWRRL